MAVTQLEASQTGADLIAEFIATHCYPDAFLVTGGACAFIVDAIGRHPSADYICFQHEQSAAMAADAIWRTTGKIGVTVTTSGPGATNLITGIACSWFDSIPTFHITGQVNQNESREIIGANVRQAGFQETDIVSITKEITKWSKKITSVEDLITSLPEAYLQATSGRMGPVLLDIPMNIQKEIISEEQRLRGLVLRNSKNKSKQPADTILKDFLENSQRPLVLIGAGSGLSGTAKVIQEWCELSNIPYVASWGAIAYIDRSWPLYQGTIGVYGSRKANWAIQSADKLLVLGSRLDNRQRTGNPNSFAPFADVLVLDIDEEELKKFKKQKNYFTKEFDLQEIGKLLNFQCQETSQVWLESLRDSQANLATGFNQACSNGDLNPYFVVQKIQKQFKPKSIVVADCGANLCWVYQAYQPDESFLFTAGGNSPMGYSLPAAIGAQLANPSKDVYCFIGDGGLQMNVQELQTIVAYDLPIKIFILNNFGYGIIKQFQDAYFDGRHFATGLGYSVPSFEKIASAYGVEYRAIETQEDLNDLKLPEGAVIIDIHLPPGALITPKTEMNRFIHDQYPYIEDDSIAILPYAYPNRPSDLANESNPTV